MTSADGPEFEEGDQIGFRFGDYEGMTGRVVGYDDINRVYVIELDVEPQWLIARAPILYRPVLMADNPSRVIVVNGPRAGEAGLASQVRNVWDGTAYFAVVWVELESGENIEISSTSLVRSEYQGEELEEVPHV